MLCNNAGFQLCALLYAASSCHARRMLAACSAEAARLRPKERAIYSVAASNEAFCLFPFACKGMREPAGGGRRKESKLSL